MKIKYNRLNIVETIFVFISLFFFSGAFFSFLNNSNEIAEDNTSFLVVFIFTLIYVFSIYFLLNKCKFYYSDIYKNKLLYILIIFVVISVFWSQFPIISFKRIFAFVGTCLVGIYLSKRYSPVPLLRILSNSLFLVSILSLVFIFVLPQFGLMDETQNKGTHIGAWKGVFIHKNVLGRIMTLQFLISYYLYSYYKIKKYIIYFLISIILIIGSQSNSSLVFLVIIFLIYFSLNRYGNFKLISKIFVSIVLIISFLLFSYFSLFLELIGRDITLTGRTILWQDLFKAINLNPFIGYGYGGFWPGADMFVDLSWAEAPHAHNGYIDLILDIGVIGLFFYFLIYFKTLSFLISKQYFFPSWFIVFLIYIGFYNLIESNILKYNNLFWLIVVYIFSFVNLNFHKFKYQKIKLNLKSNTDYI